MQYSPLERMGIPSQLWVTDPTLLSLWTSPFKHCTLLWAAQLSSCTSRLTAASRAFLFFFFK